MRARPPGTERINKGFLERKMPNGKWDRVHRSNWEAARGPIPIEMVLVHLGDPLDLQIDNWRLVPRSALVAMHARFPGGLYAAPKEVRGSIVAAAVLEDQLKRAKAIGGLLPRTRKEAIEQGEMHYFSGRRCPAGHVSKRYARKYGCMECERLRDRSKTKLLSRAEP